MIFINFWSEPTNIIIISCLNETRDIIIINFWRDPIIIINFLRILTIINFFMRKLTIIIINFWRLLIIIVSLYWWLVLLLLVALVDILLRISVLEQKGLRTLTLTWIGDWIATILEWNVGGGGGMGSQQLVAVVGCEVSVPRVRGCRHLQQSLAFFVPRVVQVLTIHNVEAVVEDTRFEVYSSTPLLFP